MNKRKFLMAWSLAVGVMDAGTGVLLVIAPGFVTGLLGIAEPASDASVFLSWMGVFITGVGLSYALALGGRREGIAVWKITSLIRLMVAAFVSWKAATGELEPRWLLVAASDGAVAVVQIFILKLGWWREGGP